MNIIVFNSPSQHLKQSYGCFLSAEITMSCNVLLSSDYDFVKHSLFLIVSDFPKQHQILLRTKVKLGTTKRDRTDQIIVQSVLLFQLVLSSAPTPQAQCSKISPCNLLQSCTCNDGNAQQQCSQLLIRLLRTTGEITTLKSVLGKQKGKDIWYSLKTDAH